VAKMRVPDEPAGRLASVALVDPANTVARLAFCLGGPVGMIETMSRVGDDAERSDEEERRA
jgi:hypothetical protein